MLSSKQCHQSYCLGSEPRTSKQRFPINAGPARDGRHLNATMKARNFCGFGSYKTLVTITKFDHLGCNRM